MSYDPLHAPGKAYAEPADVETEIAVTVRILEETAGLNIHDGADMMSAAFALNRRLRILLAAVQAERGADR